MCCIIKFTVQGKQARVKTQICVTRPQCVNMSVLLEEIISVIARTNSSRV